MQKHVFLFLAPTILWKMAFCSPGPKTPTSFRQSTDTAIVQQQTYTNPVWDHDFPDPNLVKAPDHYFYAYSTNSNWQKDGLGGPYTVPVLRSRDLVNWQFVGDAFDKRPDWKKGGIWAPDVTYYRGRYIMFYSFSIWDDPDAAIGVAVSEKPQGPFRDLGKLFSSKEIGVRNSIDPFLMIDKGKPYLVWGSFNTIYGIPLSRDGTRIAGEKFKIAGNHFEGSYIYKRGKYYYYFGSTGTCCEGTKSTYHVLVGRSTSFKGPYTDKSGKSLLDGGGTLLLQADDGPDGFVGPGHNGDIEEDQQGQTWIFYHAFHKAGTGRGGRVLLMDKVEWQDGWPVIKNAQPSFTPQKRPAFPEK